MIQWMGQHYEVPLLLSCFYLMAVFGIQAMMKDRREYSLRTALIIWNFSLALFSMVGAYCVGWSIISVLSRKTLSEEMCTNDAENEDQNPRAHFLCKIPELLDALFLVLRKRPVRFLHWYHHIFTMIFCWDAWAVQAENGASFALMNLIVHSIMYSYYGTVACGKRFSMVIRQSITSLQIVQMLLGTLIAVHNLVRCNTQPYNNTVALIMYLSYATLFTQLYVSEYYSLSSKAKSPHIPKKVN